MMPRAAWVRAGAMLVGSLLLHACVSPRPPAVEEEPLMLRRPPSEIDELLDQAYEVQQQGDHLSATLLYEDLISRAPMNPRVLNNAAYYFVASGQRYAEAEALIRRALTIEPAQPRYLDTLGYLLLQSRRFPEAVEPLERAYARADSLSRAEQRAIAVRLVTAYERTGQPHLARQVVSSYRAKDPEARFVGYE